MKVSIIIPVYNVSMYIEECLQSALEQTYQDIEYLIVNDASPDDSMEKIEALIHNHSRKNDIKIISHQVNKGISAARNSGIREATGDYLFFLDSDDVLYKNSIEVLASLAIKENPDLVISEYTLIGSNDRKKYPYITLSASTIYGEEIADAFYRKKWHGAAWNKLVKRTLFLHKECMFYEGIIQMEDILWSLFIAQYASTMCVSKENTYFYRIREGSVTQKVSTRNFDSMLLVLKEMGSTAFLKHQHKDDTALCEFLADQRIYFYKELIRCHIEKGYIRQSVKKIDAAFSDKKFSLFAHSFSYFLKVLPYKLPHSLGIMYIKLILLIQKKND
ncbi:MULTISPECIES: glycosyltransferase family 2 protein [unclassified Parabacteroides]|uniref:glycosyltransferase family 2 protein n=1 Tax=unclassified Parabacteroides TaxID=2649774 RepID=UPI002474355E|nr:MULTISPECIES: glycosyltransferase family 2 protein [unclassified Parabacteroides]